MEDVIGTWDKVNKCFVVERAEYRAATGKPNVRMSLRRLQKLYPECPGDVRGAAKYWHKYLASVLLGQNPNELARFKEFMALPDWWQHMDDKGLIREQQTTPKRNTLKAEVDAYVERRVQTYKNPKALSVVRQYLDLFLEVTGPVKPEEITRHHYEAYHQKVVTHKTWKSKRSKANAMQRLNSFLKHLESVDNKLRFGFRHAGDFKVKGANTGKKNQWGVEELRMALKLSEGNRRVRFSLLMAINTGAYWGDLMKPKGVYHGLQKEDIKGEYLREVPREKNATKEVVMNGTWWLFPETRKALMFGLSKGQLESKFTAFRVRHGLPKFLDIRKTLSQLIHDDIGETEARLWRCEELEGCIGTNYVKAFSEAQIADLKRALVYVREVLVEGKPRRDKQGNIRPGQ